MLRSAIVVLLLVGVLAVTGGVLGAIASGPGGEERGAADSDTDGDTIADDKGAAAAAPSSSATTRPGVADRRDDGDAMADTTASSGRFGAFGDDADALRACLAAARAEDGRQITGASPDEQVDRVVDAVEQLRSAQFAAAPDVALLADDAYVERALTDGDQDVSHPAPFASEDRRVLTALGAVPRDFAPQLVYDELLTSTAGLYLTDDREVVVRTDDEPTSASVRWHTSLARALPHALSDDRVGLPTAALDDRDDQDGALAARVVVEGDATLVQQQFNAVAVPPGTAEPPQPPLTAGVPRFLASTPWYVARSWQFPATAGIVFVCERYLDGGWEAVDALYDRPPRTTVEILAPERLGTAPADPPDAGDPGDGWRRHRDTTFGAASLLWLFEAPGGERSRALDSAEALAVEWTGGELTLWRGIDADRTAVAIALSQQQVDGPLCEGMVTWYERAFPDSVDATVPGDVAAAYDGDRQDAVVVCDGDDVRVGIAPDLGAARRLAD